MQINDAIKYAEKNNIDVVLIQPGPIKTAIWNKVPNIEDNPFLKTEYGESSLLNNNAKKHLFQMTVHQ